MKGRWLNIDQPVSPYYLEVCVKPSNSQTHETQRASLIKVNAAPEVGCMKKSAGFQRPLMITSNTLTGAANTDFPFFSFDVNRLWFQTTVAQQKERCQFLKHNALTQYCHKRAEEVLCIHSASASWWLKLLCEECFRAKGIKSYFSFKTGRIDSLQMHWSESENLKSKVIIVFSPELRTARTGQRHHNLTKKENIWRQHCFKFL